jgi:hypothetical protein
MCMTGCVDPQSQFKEMTVELQDITPVIITYNEEPNIGRALAGLSWAKDIVVVDSYSTDRTLEIIKTFPNARVVMHEFVGHAEKWQFAVHGTSIQTEWVLPLDADLMVSEAFANELRELTPDSETAAYEAQVPICVYGHRLPRSIYPPRIVLSRRERTNFYQDGHTHRFQVSGRVLMLRVPVDHDDRKPIAHWLQSQDRSARLEDNKLRETPRSALNLPDRLRTMIFVAPTVALFYCLIVKRLAFCGLPGWYYTYQRVIAELVLSLYLIEAKLFAARNVQEAASPKNPAP